MEAELANHPVILPVELDQDLSYTLKSLNRGQSYTKKITNTCRAPYETVVVDHESRIFLCQCTGWLPIPVGTVNQFESIQEILSSSLARTLQNNIEQKQFTWCAVSTCGITERPIQRYKLLLGINIDESCNLSCPSCRRELIMIDQGPTWEKKIHDLDKIMTWLDRYSDPIHVMIGGVGDALASHITRHLLLNYQPRQNMTFELKTNGLLLEKIMSRSPVKDYVSLYSVSVDAASKAVYEDVRRPGRWDIIMHNLSWLSANRGNSQVTLNFTVQANNYKDIPNFANLAKSLGFVASFSALEDWGTWNTDVTVRPDTWTIKNGFFKDHDVVDCSHPQHQDLLHVLKELDLLDPNLGLNPRLKNLL